MYSPRTVLMLVNLDDQERIARQLAQLSNKQLALRYHALGQMDERLVEGISWMAMLELIKNEMYRRGI